MNNLEQKTKIQNRILWVALFLAALVGTGMVAKAFSGSAQNVAENGGTINVTNNYYSGSGKLGSEDMMIGAAPVASDASHLSQEPKPTALGPTYFSSDVELDGTLYGDGAATFTGLLTAGTFTVTGQGTFGSILYKEVSTNVSAGTTTLTAADSGKTFYISGATSTIVLPATSSAITGVTYRFVVGGALSVSTTISTATGANEIEGTLIVAGAVVDCDAEDTITIGASVENIGDYVEFRYSGTYWMLGDSGALTATALTCTAT